MWFFCYILAMIKKPRWSLGVTASAEFQNDVTVLAAAFFSEALIFERAVSIGLKPGLQGGREWSSALV